MKSKFQLFISSTTSLKKVREKLKMTLSPDYEVYISEKDRNPSSPPNRHLRRKIKESDVFVLLLGPDFGSAMPRRWWFRLMCLPDKNRPSVVQWELDNARKLRKKTLGFEQSVARQTKDTRQLEFIQSVTRIDGVWRNFFPDAAKLVSLIEEFLKTWHRDYHSEMKAKIGKLDLRAEVVFAAIATSAVLALVSLLIVPEVPGRLVAAQALLFLAPILAMIVWLNRD